MWQHHAAGSPAASARDHHTRRRTGRTPAHRRAACTLKRLDLTGYILRNVLPQAEADIRDAEQLKLSERNSLRVLELLENPPPAPARLVRAARTGFTLP